MRPVVAGGVGWLMARLGKGVDPGCYDANRVFATGKFMSSDAVRSFATFVVFSANIICM
jgi:hypothetical protein